MTAPTPHYPGFPDYGPEEGPMYPCHGPAWTPAAAAGLRRVFSKFGLGRELYGGEGAKARQKLHAKAATNGHVPAPQTDNGSATEVLPTPAETHSANGHNLPADVATWPATPEHWNAEIEGRAVAHGKDGITYCMRWIRAVETNPFRKSGALATCYKALASLAPDAAALDWIDQHADADNDVNSNVLPVIYNTTNARRAELERGGEGAYDDGLELAEFAPEGGES